MNRSGIRYTWLMARLLFLKVCYLGLLATLLSLWGDSIDFTRTEVRWPRVGAAVFESHFAAWDGAHYLLLATDGYSKGVSSCAFYPLWPTLMRLFGEIGISPLWGGLAIANVASSAAWALFYTVAVRKIGASAANSALILLITYPGSLFFQFPYTESLFFLELMVLMDALDREDLQSGLVAAYLLPMTRAIGLFVLVPLGWQILVVPLVQKWSSMRQPPGHFNTNQTEVGKTLPFGRMSWLLLAAPILGWATYLGLMWHWTGNPLEGFVAQRRWGRHSISNLVDIPGFLVEMMDPTHWHEFSGSLVDRVLFLPVALSVPLIWKRHREWLLWVYILGILPAMSGGFTSFTRFGTMAAPCFWIWGEYLTHPSKRLARNTVIGIFIVLHLVLLWRFVNFRWAG